MTMIKESKNIKDNEIIVIKRLLNEQRGLLEEWQILKILHITRIEGLLKGIELIGYYKKLNHLGK